MKDRDSVLSKCTIVENQEQGAESKGQNKRQECEGGGSAVEVVRAVSCTVLFVVEDPDLIARCTT